MTGSGWDEKQYPALAVQQMTRELFGKIECSHFQLCDYSEPGGEREMEKFIQYYGNVRKVLMVNIASIFVHNVITERASNMFLSSNKLKSIESNESISSRVPCGICWNTCIYVIRRPISGMKLSLLDFFCNRQKTLHLFMMNIIFYWLLVSIESSMEASF